MSKDPLVTTVRFALPFGAGNDSSDDWDWYATDRKYRDPMERTMDLCYDGPFEWFGIPEDCRELWVVISPYPDPNSYLIEDPWSVTLRGYDNDGDETSTSFYNRMGNFLRAILRKHPQYNFYFAIEVANDKTAKGSRSRIRAPRLVHATRPATNRGDGRGTLRKNEVVERRS